MKYLAIPPHWTPNPPLAGSQDGPPPHLLKKTWPTPPHSPPPFQKQQPPPYCGPAHYFPKTDRRQYEARVLHRQRLPGPTAHPLLFLKPMPLPFRLLFPKKPGRMIPPLKMIS